MAPPARAPRPIDPPAPPPSLSNLFGLLPELPEWLQGDPEVQANEAQRQAEADARIAALRQRLYGMVPAPVKRAAKGAKDYVTREYLTPPPEVEALRQRVKGAMTSPAVAPEGAAPIERAAVAAANAPRAVPEFLIDQAAAAQTPADLALNALPQGKAAALGAKLAVGVPPITLGGRRPLGSLAAGLRGLKGEARYELKPSVIARYGEAYPIGRELGARSLPTWESAQGERVMRAFDDNAQRAYLWARLLGASSAGTDVPKNTTESVAALAHALQYPGQQFRTYDIPGEFKVDPRTGLSVPKQGLSLWGRTITNAGSKVPNFNRILAGEPMSGDKVEAFGQFLWGDPRSPIDRHIIWGAGSEQDKFSEQIPALRELMLRHEGLKQISNSGIYRRYEDALMRGLQSLDPNREYHPLFADTWEGLRELKGLKPQGGPAGLITAEGLGERGAMLDPERLIWTLQQTQGRNFRLPR